MKKNLRSLLIEKECDEKMKEYTFERLWKELSEGYQIYYTYMDIRYLLTKVNQNCYLKKMITEQKKGPHPKEQILTLHSVKALLPFMENIEYKI